MRPLACLLAAASLAAADAAPPTADGPRQIPRLVGQLLVGTAGLEAGAAAEWTLPGEHPLRLRPELLLNDRSRPGLGASVLWGILAERLHEQHELFVGPRLVYHNNRRGSPNRDGERLEYGLEFGGFGQYVFPIVPTRPGEHWIEILVGVGMVDHYDDWDPAFTAGAGYGYQF